MSQVNFFTETSTVGEDAQAGLGAGGVGARPLALASGAVATQAGLPAAAGQHLRARHPAVPLRPILQLPFLVWREEGYGSKRQGARRQACGRGWCRNPFGGCSRVRESLLSRDLDQGGECCPRAQRPSPTPDPSFKSLVTVLGSPSLKLCAWLLAPRAGTPWSLQVCRRLQCRCALTH